MLDYRVTKSSRFQQYEKCNPHDVLHGLTMWSNLPARNEGKRFSDIEDAFGR